MYCPLLTDAREGHRDVAAILARLRDDIVTLCELLKDNSAATIGDVLNFVHTHRIAQLDEKFLPYLEGDVPRAERSDPAAVSAFLTAPVKQLWGYRRYIETESPFATQQGIKGAQFERVLVVLDDEESNYNLFSYAKYFGIEDLSERDQGNIASGNDSVLGRTLRLFYVCCSRAVHDLAILFFVPDVALTKRAVIDKGLLPAANVHTL